MRKNKDKSEQNKEQVLKSTRNLQKKQKTHKETWQKSRETCKTCTRILKTTAKINQKRRNLSNAHIK